SSTVRQRAGEKQFACVDVSCAASYLPTAAGRTVVALRALALLRLSDARTTWYLVSCLLSLSS
ncbi:MAG: hypothetical protein ACK53Y_12060, partial [bacterium]